MNPYRLAHLVGYFLLLVVLFAWLYGVNT